MSRAVLLVFGIVTCTSLGTDAPRFSLQALPTTVSGSLKPFSVAVAGVSLIRGKKTIRSLSINGRTVQAAQDRHRTFYTTSTKEHLHLRWPGGSESVTLPSITKVSAEAGELLLTVSPQVRSISIDRKIFNKSGQQVRWPIPPRAAGRIFVIELKSALAGRFYNLRFEHNRKLAAATAPKIVTTPAVPRTQPALFALAPLLITQSSGGMLFSLELSWKPSLPLTGPWSLQGQLGFSALKRRDGAFFPALGYELALHYQATGTLGAYAGGGGFTWFGNGGSGVAATLGGSYALREKHWSLLNAQVDHLYFQISRLFAPNSAWKTTAGVVFEL